MPLIRITEGARIVTVASDAHFGARIDFSDPEMKTGYAGFKAYSRSKLANVLFTFALARRLAGSGITANCLHPGVVASGFLRSVPFVGAILPVLARPFMITNAEGAKTSVFLASSETVAGQNGGYYDKSALTPSSAASLVEADQERLWASLEMTGADWGF
jgi:NAD(P)-dependent dehydrogenase (short-subunit alcohol dehydrogenase family)